MTVTTQHTVVTEPESGQVIALPVGARLELRFHRRGLGLSAWHVEDRPSHLVPLHEGSHGFQFLVFRGGEDRVGALRLVRRRSAGPDFSEVRDLTVVVSP